MKMFGKNKSKLQELRFFNGKLTKVLKTSESIELRPRIYRNSNQDNPSEKVNKPPKSSFP